MKNYLSIFLLVVAIGANAQHIVPEVRKLADDIKLEFVVRGVDANAITPVDYITRFEIDIENKSEYDKVPISFNKSYLVNEAGCKNAIKAVYWTDKKHKYLMPKEKVKLVVDFARASGVVNLVIPNVIEMDNIDVSFSWKLETDTILDDKHRQQLVDVINPVVKEYKEGTYKLYYEISPNVGIVSLSDAKRPDPRDEFFAKKEKYDGYIEWLDRETRRIELPPYFNSDNINDSLWDLRIWGRYQNTKFRLEQKYNSNQDNITKQTLSNGYYIGNVFGNKRQGLGMYVWKIGQCYLGEWNDNDMTGFGYYFDDDSIYYAGQYKNDKREGKGFYYWQTSRLKYLGFYSEKYLGDFSEGSLKEGIKYCPKYYYVGDFNGWNFGERGMIMYRSGNYYVGEWSSAQEEGFGTEYWANGEKLIYQGNFHDGKFHGRGIMLMRDGSVQMGKWEYGHYKGNPEIITAEELWNFPIALPYKVIAQHIVDKEINDWAKRGMTERYDEWMDRTEPEKIDRQVYDSILPWIRGDYLKNAASKSELNMKLKDYDPKNENFLLVDSIFGEMLIDVKKDKATRFKDLWETKNIGYLPTYFFNGNKIEVKTISFVDDKLQEIGRVKNNLEHEVPPDIDYERTVVVVDDGTPPPPPPPPPTKSDVDTAIPITNIKRERPCYVLIIANENYKYVSNVPYALNDGKVFEEYCKKTLCIRNDIDRVRSKPDATLGEIKESVEDLIKFVNARNGGVDVIFFYAGHGYADRDNTYLMPTDVTTKGYKLQDLYSQLSELKAHSVVCFLDACYSGDVMAGDGSRSIVLGSMEIPEGTDNLIVFTASLASEQANPFKEQGHGMFTYFILKKLKESKGKVSLGELFEYVKESVSNEANKIFKSQIPDVIPSNNMKEVWRKMKL